jgi:hypothetical protein
VESEITAESTPIKTGDKVTVTATVTDPDGVASVTADAAAFGAGQVDLQALVVTVTVRHSR